MYLVVAELEQLWILFENQVSKIHNIDLLHLADIKKLMTSEFVIDLSLHEIYKHSTYVHELTQNLIALKNAPEELKIKCCESWLNLLQKRNQIPLKIKHHQRLDGECDFRFSLQLMQGHPSGFKEIQVLNHKNKENIQEAVKFIHQLDCLAIGISFGSLSLIKDTVLTSLMEFDDVICLIARDQSDQIIGHCWGILLRNIEVSPKNKINVFWVMDLAKHPDFVDANVKIGDQLRNEMIKQIKSRNDCAFVGYQHIPNHKFHMNIIANTENNIEQVRLNNEKFTAQTALKYNDDLGLYVRAHFIRTNDHIYAYPQYADIKPAILKAFWRAAHSAKDFLIGGLAFFGRNQYQKSTHNLMNSSIEQRLAETISIEQQICDANTLKQIILSEKWLEQGKGIYSAKFVPEPIDKLQDIVRDEDNDFLSLKTSVNNNIKNISQKNLATLLYKAISIADSPTFVLNELLKNEKTPNDWIELISTNRNGALNQQKLGTLKSGVFPE